MTKRTWWFRSITTVLILGLTACSGGGGGGGGSGGGSLPTATNPAITPPSTQAVAITTAGGTTSAPNQSLAANSYQASNEPLNNAAVGTATAALPVGVQAANSGTAAVPNTLAALVRRQAEKIKDHKPSVTGVLKAEPPRNCAVSGTDNSAFDDANNNFTEVFVNCNEFGEVIHGTLAATNVSVAEQLGSMAGTPYSISVQATFSIDLSIATTQPASSVVTQGSFTFIVSFSGLMQAAPDGSVEPGDPSTIHIELNVPSLLSQTVNQSGTLTERLSSFDVIIDTSNTAGTTVTGGYTYASTAFGAGGRQVVVSIKSPIVTPTGASHPSSGTVEITSPPSPGKIVLTVLSSTNVKVDVFANAADAAPTDTITLTWAQVDAL